MLRIIRSRDYPTRPWKNGGGTTRDIVVTPADASLDDFHWRLSLAQVDRDGPFSRFDNVDRTLVLLDGAMTLHEQSRRIDLVRGEPFAFEGERAIEAALAGSGSTLDFNVMTRRSRAWHTVRREFFDRRESVVATDASTLILFALDSGLTIDGEKLGAHDTVVAAQHALVVASEATAAALIVEVVEIRPNVL